MAPPINRLPRARPAPDAVARPAPDAVVRPAPDAVVRPVPDEVLHQLADRGKVPADRGKKPNAKRKFFFDSIRTNVQTAWELDGLVKGGLANEKGATLYRATLELYEMLGNLNEDERKLIEGILGKSGLFGRISSGGVGGIRETAYQLAELFSIVTGEPHPRYPHQGSQSRHRGKKPGWVKHPIFHKFAFDIYLSTKVADGYLTFDKNGPMGTWVDAFEMLGPYLPDGFVPEPLPGSALQRLKTWCDKI
jgi:hypothetical protein